jgi:antitoxin PrlF
MVYVTKLSAKYQIVIPRDARRQLGLAAGDRLLLEVRDGALVLTPRPTSYAKHLRGLHREVWRDVDPQKYVHEERKGWR